MKTTEHFQNTIESYLRDRAETDELFAISFSNPDKSIEQCITYILNCVKKSGCNGFCDEEILSMAVHYYDELNIEVGNPIDCRVIVNHTVELTAEEKEQARQNALNGGSFVGKLSSYSISRTFQPEHGISRPNRFNREPERASYPGADECLMFSFSF